MEKKIRKRIPVANSKRLVRMTGMTPRPVALPDIRDMKTGGKHVLPIVTKDGYAGSDYPDNTYDVTFPDGSKATCWEMDFIRTVSILMD